MVEDRMTGTTFWTPGRIIATLVVMMLIAVIGFTLFSGGSRSSTNSRITLPGTPVSEAGSALVPEDYAVPTLDAGAVKLSDYRGKVVVLDFWATWCPPCREEIPQLARLARENRSRGLEVVGLHVERERPDQASIRKFMNQYGIGYTVGLASDEMASAYMGGETAIPQTLVFDRKGRLVLHLIGYSPADARTLDEAVNRALAE